MNFAEIKSIANLTGVNVYTGSMGGHKQTDIHIVGERVQVRRTLACMGVSFGDRAGVVQKLHTLDGELRGTVNYANDGLACASFSYALVRPLNV